MSLSSALTDFSSESDLHCGDVAPGVFWICIISKMASAFWFSFFADGVFFTGGLGWDMLVTSSISSALFFASVSWQHFIISCNTEFLFFQPS